MMLSNSVFYVPSDVKITLNNPKKFWEILLNLILFYSIKIKIKLSSSQEPSKCLLYLP